MEGRKRRVLEEEEVMETGKKKITRKEGQDRQSVCMKKKC